MTLKELREKRAELAKRMLEMRDALQKDAKLFDEAQWQAINKDYDDLSMKIEVAERADAVTAEMAAVKTVDIPGRDNVNHEVVHENAAQDRSLAMRAWLRAGFRQDRPSTVEVEAAQRLGMNLGAGEIEFRINPTDPERRALSAAIGSTGGFTVPEGFVNKLEDALLQFGGMLSVAEVITTTQGNDLPMPMVDDTGNTGTEVAESGANTTEANPAFSSLTLKAIKYTSKLIKIPSELLQDSAFDIEGFIARKLGERLGRIGNTRWTTGTGANQPKGIVPSATTGVTTASATAITYEEVLDLIDALDSAYEPGARFMFHKKIATYLRKLKSTSQYLWQPDLSAGTPGFLANFPYTYNSDMASTVASAQKTMLFGQLNSYKIRLVGSVRLLRLNELYAANDQIGMTAFMRFDGGLLDAGTHPVQLMLQNT